MHFILFLLAFISPDIDAQGVPTGIAPAGGNPPGCNSTAPGRYAVQSVQVAASKRSLERRLVDCSSSAVLTVQIINGVMTDSAGRIAEIVGTTRQLVFASIPTTGSIYTGGFALCANSSLALGPSTILYECMSGNVYGIYDQPVSSGCIAINHQLLLCAESHSLSSTSVPNLASQAIIGQSSPTELGSSTAASITGPLSSSTSSSPTSSVASPSLATITTILSSSASSDSGQLTVGGKAAIGVPVPLAMIALIIGVFLLGRKFGRRKPGHGNGMPATVPQTELGILVEKEPGVAVM